MQEAPAEVRDASGMGSSSSPAQKPAAETSEAASIVSLGDPPSKKEFSLEDLQAEIDRLRADPPSYLKSVGHLKVPSMACDKDDKMARVSDGLWDLIVVLNGGPENPAYDYTFRIGLRFDRSWPSVPPDVRFNCVIHHAIIDEQQNMIAPWYHNLPKDEAGNFSLAEILNSVHRFLIEPCATIGIEKKQSPMRLTMAIMQNEEMNKSRLDVIQKYGAQRVHPELFEFPQTMRQEWFAPEFWDACQNGSPEAFRQICREELPGEVFSMPLFTDAFCDMLVAEIMNFYASGLPARRPNSMNNYGIILNEIGMEPFITELQRYLQPIGECFFPGPGSVWDGHHCFIVRYREGEDLGLDMHTDDSDVTFNMCLGLDFDGAGLQFCGLMGAKNHRKHTFTYKHEKARCCFHLGRKRHGADDITRGERLNLILWNHSNTYRSCEEYKSPPYVKEEGPPDAVCVSYTHDRDFGIYKEYPSGKDKFKGRGWCPPKPYEYENFKIDHPPVGGG